jgi:hypothetical protein
MAVLRELKAIKKEKKFMVKATDKNLGLAIMETTLYIKRALNNHLLNTTEYILQTLQNQSSGPE